MNNHQTVVRQILNTKAKLVSLINKNKGNSLKIPRHYNLAASDYSISYNNNEIRIIPSIGSISVYINDSAVVIEEKLSGVTAINTDVDFEKRVMITWLELVLYQIQNIIKYYDK
jgi:hypothetical protein